MRKDHKVIIYCFLSACGIAVACTVASRFDQEKPRHIKDNTSANKDTPLSQNAVSNLPRETDGLPSDYRQAGKHQGLKADGPQSKDKHDTEAFPDGTPQEGSASDRRTVAGQSSGETPHKTAPAATSKEQTQAARADEPQAPEKTSVERLREIVAQMEGPCQVFSSTAGDFAIAKSENGYTLTTPDGQLYEFTATEEELALALSSGTVCQFIAGNENFSIGKMTDQAFILITDSGVEYTLKADAENAAGTTTETNPASSTETATQKILNDLLAVTEHNPLGVFKSTDNNYAMMITEDLNHILITPDGSSYNFRPIEHADTLITTSGTQAPLVATGEGLAIANLTDDSYVVLAQAPEDNAVPYEFTLFEANNNAAATVIISSGGSIGLNSAALSNGSGSSSAGSVASASSGSESASTATTTEGSTASTASPSDSTDSTEATTTVASTSTTQTTPLWAMSMAERRAANRQVWIDLDTRQGI